MMILRRRVLLGILPLLGLGGCDRPNAAAPPAAAAQPESAQILALILPPEETSQLGVWEQIAMVTAGREKAIFRAERPAAGEPASRQAELIRSAVGGGATALLVIAQDPKAVAPALEEAREQGVSVVLLDRPVPSATKPFTLVAYEPLESVTKKLVEATRSATKTVGMSPDGPAVVLIREPSDDLDRALLVTALKKTLGAAGVALLPDRTYSGEKQSAPAEVFTSLLALKDRPTMIYIDDDTGLAPIARIRSEQGDVPNRPMLAGFIANRVNVDMVTTNQLAAAVDLNQNALPARAVVVALDQARGETFPERIEVPRPVLIAKDPTRPRTLGPPSIERSAPKGVNGRPLGG